jgi:predicted Zn-dependent protease
VNQGRHSNRSATAAVLLLALLAAVLVSCGVRLRPAEPRGEEEAPAPTGEGPGRREQPLALNPRQELEIGRRAYDEVMAEYRDRLQPPGSPEVRRCRRVMERLAKAAEIEPLQREINLRIRGYRFEWEVNVIREATVNAFCLPAGKTFVFTGILKVIGGDDDFLATVISHEMAHALAHHASERIARDRSGGGGVLRKLSYQRGQEAEADHVGVFLMTFADFDPDKASAFWERMRQASGAHGRERPEWLSDHPSHENRARMLAEWAKHARQGKRAYDAGHVAPPRRR